MLGVRVALSRLGLPFAGFALRRATAGLLGATAELVAVEVSGHSDMDEDFF